VKLLEDMWKRRPHPDLIEAYLALWPSEPPLERLKRIQQLTASNPQHLESRVALAQASLDADLWGEARRNLANISEADQSVRVCRLMARIEEEEPSAGDRASARLWHDPADTADADASWTCGDCGAVAGEWSALCGNCGAFDTISWKRPPRVAALIAAPEGDAVVVDEAGAGPSDEAIEIIEAETIEDPPATANQDSDTRQAS